MSAASRRDSILLAYQHRLLRDALARLLGELGMPPEAEAASGQELLALARRMHPTLVLVDWDLPDAGPDLLEKLSELTPKPAVVALAKPGTKEQLAVALQAGVRGFLSLNMPSGEFEQSLQLLLRGDLIVSGDIVDDLSEALAADGVGNEGVYALSDREREVLSLIGTGRTNREIAESLIVTENTVKVHLRNVLDKLNLRNRQQAAAFAAREGLTEEVPEGEPNGEGARP